METGGRKKAMSTILEIKKTADDLKLFSKIIETMANKNIGDYKIALRYITKELAVIDRRNIRVKKS